MRAPRLTKAQLEDYRAGPFATHVVGARLFATVDAMEKVLLVARKVDFASEGSMFALTEELKNLHEALMVFDYEVQS